MVTISYRVSLTVNYYKNKRKFIYLNISLTRKGPMQKFQFVFEFQRATVSKSALATFNDGRDRARYAQRQVDRCQSVDGMWVSVAQEWRAPVATAAVLTTAAQFLAGS